MTSEKDLSYIHESLRALATPISDLSLDPKNARHHGEPNQLATRASLQEFGQRSPVVVQRQGMIVRAGNNRVQQAQELGWTHVAAIICDEDDATALAFALADNRSSELATWDEQALAEHIRDLREIPDDVPDLSTLGWSTDELDALVQSVAVLGDVDGELDGDKGPRDDPPDGVDVGASPLADDADEIPDTPIDPITKLGDVVQLGAHTLHCADCLDVLFNLPDDSVDAIATDPPYGIGFMGKDWDCSVPGQVWARECLRVLKPGGHLVASAATRTYHRLACAVEDAGFEIRDQLGWLQWQGFPKSLDVSKAIDEAAGAEREVVGKLPNPGSTNSRISMGDGWQQSPDITAPATDDAKKWAGWGTGLKPSIEPFVLARKPCSEKTVAANVLRWGTGAINIDACRIKEGDKSWPGPTDFLDLPAREVAAENNVHTFAAAMGHHRNPSSSKKGRWPANIFYCPKPARSEKEVGCEDLAPVDCGIGALRDSGRGKVAGNIHPTVKPAKLMRWLLQLVTPPGGTVFEPFAGSGTTLVAAEGLDCRVIAAELEPGYCDIIRARCRDPELPTRLAADAAE